MKILRFTALGMALGLLMAGQVVAQSEPQLTIPASARQVAYDYDYYADTGTATAEKAATPAKPATPTTAAAPAQQQLVEDEGPTSRWARDARQYQDGKLADPWTLQKDGSLKSKNITFGGWVESGVYGNQYGNASNGPLGLRSIGDGFTADQAWFFAERKTDTKGCGWDIGGRVDYMFGTDGPDIQSYGDRSFDYGWNTSRDYGSAMPQLYTDIAYNDVNLRVGHFFTPIGYEVVPAPQNFFYSHSYMQYYAEPFTHTGALASYKPGEKVTYYGGWTNGWDEGFNGDNKGSTFLGGLSIQFNENTSLAWYCSAGKIGNGSAFAGALSGDVYMNSFVFTRKLNEKWTYVFQHDLGTNYDVEIPGQVNNQWYGLSNYLFYKINDVLSYGGRFEVFQDPQGARVGNGALGNYYELTAGFNYKPHSNITIRPELRYDWFDGFAGNTTSPFDGGTKDTQVSLGTDFIFTY
jgi:hypothetical protein